MRRIRRRGIWSPEASGDAAHPKTATSHPRRAEMKTAHPNPLKNASADKDGRQVDVDAILPLLNLYLQKKKPRSRDPLKRPSRPAECHTFFSARWPLQQPACNTIHTTSIFQGRVVGAASSYVVEFPSTESENPQKLGRQYSARPPLILHGNTRNSTKKYGGYFPKISP